MSRFIRSLCIVSGLCILPAASIATQTIEGRAINTANGQGVSGVKVRILPAYGSPSKGYSTTTDSQGRFRIEDVRVGAYRAWYSAPDFSPVPNPGEQPPAFTVGEGVESVRLEAKLEPRARISGRVSDATGKPVPNAAIWLVQESRWCMPPECRPDHRQSNSDEKGEYSVSDLVPGPWLVAATAPPSWDAPEPRGDEQPGWTQTFYPGVIDPRLAQPVTLRPGTEQSNMDVTLAVAPIHRIRGRLVDPNGNPAAGISVSLDKDFGPSLKGITNESGAFEFAVVDDRWTISASADRNGVKLKSAAIVELHGHDIEGVEMHLNAPFTLHGKMVAQVPGGVSGSALPMFEMLLVSAATQISDDAGIFLHIEADGENLTIQDVYPGSWQLEFFTDSLAPYYVDSISLGEKDALGSFPIASAALPLIVRFGLGGGGVRGTVDGCDQRDVLLVPEEPALRRAGFLRATKCDVNGHFEFAAMRPGEYYGLVLAKEQHSRADITDERVLRRAGKVSVNANETTQVSLQ